MFDGPLSGQLGRQSTYPAAFEGLGKEIRHQQGNKHERIAPAGHPDRNLTHLRESLLKHAPFSPEQIHALPVESSDLNVAARRYAATLVDLAGFSPVLDFVHLGLGPDGHTASLVPGDSVVGVTNTYLAVTGIWCWDGRRGE